MPFGEIITTTMPGLKQAMHEKCISCMELSELSGVCFQTILNARKGKPVMDYTAEAIEGALKRTKFKKKYQRTTKII